MPNGKAKKSRRGPHDCTMLKVSAAGARKKAGRVDTQDDLDTMARATLEGTSQWHLFECKLSDCGHIRKGLWAIDTVNPNAWSNAQDYLGRTGADIVCVQEARIAGDDTVCTAEQTARGAGWKAAISHCDVTKAGGRSAGVAIAARSYMGTCWTPGARPDDNHDLPRFAVRKVGAIAKGGINIGTIYLQDSIGIANRVNLDLLQRVASILRTLEGPWILAGDWNGEPAELVGLSLIHI